MRLRRSQRPVAGLPDGHQFALTWEIPDNFGGLTKAMLQRSSAFAESGGTPVSILTFSLQADLDDVRAELRTRGLLREGVTIHNMWEDLRTLPDDMLRKADVDPQFTEPRESGSDGGESLVSEGAEFARVFRDAGPDGMTRVEVLRTDGTVVATQLWTRVGTDNSLCEFGDVVLETALWARDGSFIGGWDGSWGLWKFWVGLAMADPDSYAVLDSSVIADFMAHLGSGGATTIYLFHNNHLGRRREPPYAPLNPWRRYVSEHHTNFNANVFLTDNQRLDFGKLLGDVDNGYTVPNIVAGVATPPRAKRVDGRGVVLARFTQQKRLDHALRAIATASASHPGLHLDLYGSGPREEELRSLAADLGAPTTFRGYTDSPAMEFARSSFSLLTSTHEGLGLSVIESMAAGCVPLAYDIPYGPSDIITHGVDGFLVPAGNHRAMAKQIGEFLDLDPRAVSKMRDAGRKRSQDFSPEPIIGMWGEAMRAARQREVPLALPASPETLSAQEKRAAATRFLATTLHAELVDTSWQDDTRLRMTVRIHLSGDNATKDSLERDVVGKLIHRPSGEARPVPLSYSADLVRPQDPPGSRYVVLDIDVSDISGELDHTVLLAMACEGDLVWDVIRTRRRLQEWLAFPAASTSRPVVVFDNNRGIELATAAPMVAATATADGNDVTLHIQSLIGGTVENVRAVGRKGAPTVESERISRGVFGLHLPPSGTWEVRATVDDIPRLVAWATGAEELHAASDPLEPVSISSTPRGYIRLASSPTRAAITDLGEDVASGILVESTDAPVGIVAVSPSGGEHAVPTLAAAEGRFGLDLSGLPEGTFTLHSANGSGLPIASEIQDRLPRSTTRGQFVFTARRAPRKNALVVDVSNAYDNR